MRAKEFIDAGLPLIFETVSVSGYDEIQQLGVQRNGILSENFFQSKLVRSTLRHYLRESKKPEVKQVVDYIHRIPSESSVKVGDHLAVLGFEIMFGYQEIEVMGFLNPKKVINIKTNSSGKINYIEFDDHSRWPEVTLARYEGHPLTIAKFFTTRNSAEKELTALTLALPNEWDLYTNELTEALSEAPIPADWDAPQVAVSDDTSFESRLAYAKKRARTAGFGSSRVAFVIPYQGRDTILKIARNSKGLAQNLEEAKILSNQALRQFGLLIPIIDYDTSAQVSWIHTEMASPYRSEEALSAALGADIHLIIELVDAYNGKFNKLRWEYDDAEGAVQYLLKKLPPEGKEQAIKIAKYLHALTKNSALSIRDLGNPLNWGEYKGHPVIIDAGLAGSALPLYGLSGSE